MSQVKPGPKREEAVAMKVSRREGTEEKEVEMAVRKDSEQISWGSWGVGDCKRGIISVMCTCEGAL